MSDNNKQFDEIEWKDTLKKAGEDACDRHRKSIEKIKEIAKSVDVVCLFIAVYANLGFGAAEHFDDHTYGTVPAKVELLAYHLYPYFEYSNVKKIQLHKDEKSIRRMLGSTSNPTLKNFVGILKACSKTGHLELKICHH